jgi:hypothetical protein
LFSTVLGEPPVPSHWQNLPFGAERIYTEPRLSVVHSDPATSGVDRGHAQRSHLAAVVRQHRAVATNF